MSSMPRLPTMTAGTPIQDAHRPCGTCDARSSAVAPPAAQYTLLVDGDERQQEGCTGLHPAVQHMRGTLHKRPGAY
jgi:hypothetical protein